MDEKIDEKMEAKKNEAYRAGVVILVILAVLSIGEFWVGSIATTWWFVLMLIAALKAFFVIRDYMHLPRLFASEEENH